MAFPWGPLAALAIVASALVARCRVRRGIMALTGILAAVWIVMGFWIAPSVDSVRSGEKLIAAMERKLGPQDEVGMVAWKEQFLLHATRPVAVFGHRRFDVEQELYDGAAWLEAGSHRRLFVARRERDRCFGARGALVGHAHRESWYLVDGTELDAACRGKGRLLVAHVYTPPL
jgi:hypothetical protein